MLCGIPYYLDVNTKILVSYFVSHSYNIFPWNIRSFVPDCLRDMLGCLADNLNAPN